MQKWKKVCVGKIDLDTIGCAYINEVTRDDRVEVARSGKATDEELADEAVLCIEVGGSGRVGEGNFDHHDVGGPEKSATMQAFDQLVDRLLLVDREYEQMPQNLGVLADYIHEIDVRGPTALKKEQVDSGEGFPFLSDVIAGMFLTERNPVEQLYRGVEILDQVIRSGQHPKGTIKGFDSYVDAKRENSRRVTEAIEKAEWTITAHGRKLAYLESDFIGAPGALYNQGAEIVVAFSPKYGNPPVPKFTIAGNKIQVDRVLPILNEMEQGWGGPPTGTIVGSPRGGSKLSLVEVVKIVSEIL